MPCVRLVREKRCEARVRHLCIGRRDCEFARDYGVLLACRLCCGDRSGGHERFSAEVSALLSRAVNRAAGHRILATAPRSAMRSEGQDCGTGIALDRSCRRRGNDFVPATDRGIDSGPAVRAMKMKRRSVILSVLGALLLFAGAYFWGPSKTPPTQKPFLTLSTANFSEFEAAFDEAADAPRMLLLLSPT